MNQVFKNRIIGVYRPHLQRLLGRINDTLQQIRSNVSMSKEQKSNQKNEQLRIQQFVQHALPILVHQNRWCDQNIERLKNSISTLTIFRKGAANARDSSQIISEINLHSQNLQFTQPEIINYKLKGSDFRINDVPSDMKASAS